MSDNTAIYAVLKVIDENLRKNVEEAMVASGYDLNFFKSEINKIKKYEEDVERLIKERNELVKKLNDISLEINEYNKKIISEKSKLKSIIDKYIQNIESLMNIYDRNAVLLPESELKSKFPDLYNFVELMRDIVSEVGESNVNMYTILDTSNFSKTKNAIKYYLITNFKHAKGLVDRGVSLSEAARKFGIRAATINATIRKYYDNGIIVKVKPIRSLKGFGTIKEEYEIKSATIEYGKGEYRRNTSIDLVKYEDMVNRELSKKHS